MINDQTIEKNDYRQLITVIAQQTGVQFSPASSQNLDALTKLDVPESVLTFYRSFEPQECAQNPNGIRLWNIAAIIEENSALVPGCYISLYGYVVFATTIAGDVYCFDTNSLNSKSEPQIVLFPHDEIDEEISPEEIRKFAKPIAKNLFEFLSQFARNEVDEECIYNF